MYVKNVMIIWINELWFNMFCFFLVDFGVFWWKLWIWSFVVFACFEWIGEGSFSVV